MKSFCTKTHFFTEVGIKYFSAICANRHKFKSILKLNSDVDYHCYDSKIGQCWIKANKISGHMSSIVQE